MHWTAAQPGDLDAERELILIDQTPGEIVFLSVADTDLACVAEAWTKRFGSRLRIAHAAPLRQPVAADHYIENVVRHAKLLVARLLGGRNYFQHFAQALSDLKDETPDRPKMLMLPCVEGDDDLAGLSDFSPEVCRAAFEFFKEGGPENLCAAAECIELLMQNRVDDLPHAKPMPQFGTYRRTPSKETRQAWVCFYRAWYQTGDLAVIDALNEALELRGFSVRSFYSFSMRDPAAQAELLMLEGDSVPDVIITTQSFSIGSFTVFEKLGCVVIQAPVAFCSRDAWANNAAGVSPSEVAMNIALPEIDGRVLATVVGFKEDDRFFVDAEITVKRLRPDLQQIAFVADLAANHAKLRELPNTDKRVAIILSNYPNRDGRIGNGVGLDTPASVVNLLRALKMEGYALEPLPENGEELMSWLQSGVTNDPACSYGKPCYHALAPRALEAFLDKLPSARVEEIKREWGLPKDEEIAVAGIRLDNVFVGIQPPRGFSGQPQAIYHSPTLPPPPAYLAFYLWIREAFAAHAVIHLGKHGNLEWLPGRGVALGADDYPQLCLGPLPHFYPFIVNNPGEGTQAKRRSCAAIVDHLTPPLTRAGLYDDLDKMERLLEERMHCVTLYPSRAAELERQIGELLATASWRGELPEAGSRIEAIGNFLCEIKESQIRSGLHILGERPCGEREIDFLLSLLRMPAGNRPGLLETLHGGAVDLQKLPAAHRDTLDQRAREWIANACEHSDQDENESLKSLRQLVRNQLLPGLARCEDELRHLVDGLDGRFIPPGPAGTPTRGRTDVLPTGRNFFGIDPRVIPTPTSWRCGKAMADLVIERYRQEQGEYLRKLAMVIWGTSNMRTGGDDIAQALWLWGCEPVWEEPSGRVIDFRILPLSLLGRPRVDVLLRVSGLFRDAFGETMRLLATVPKRLAALDEPPEMNPLRESWLRASDEASKWRATLRVFSSGPGAYGAGLLPLIDAGNWSSLGDLAEVFCKWGGHAFDSDGSATEEIDLLRARLGEVEVVHQNQDNREHDILDSDDYFQFHGGLHASVEAIRGKKPTTYHGDSSRPDEPRIRHLREEMVRVIRSRVLNPRWIEAMRRHGYKGAFEVAATIDYLFGYGATTGVVEDHHYDEVAGKLLLAPEQREFLQRHNPAAMQDAAKRLLEAAERGLWTNPNPETIAQLEDVLLELEGQLE